MKQALDPRITPARPDLAAGHLRGVVSAPRYVEGETFQVRESVIDMRREPRPDCAVDTQLLYGERVMLYDEEEGWKPTHIRLADEANLLLIAPATANIIAKLAHGIADGQLVGGQCFGHDDGSLKRKYVSRLVGGSESVVYKMARAN